MTTSPFNVLIMALFLCLSPSLANAKGWYNVNWDYRKEITIDYTKVGSVGAPHTNFPVLISLVSDAGLSANAQADGDDILFTSSDGTTKIDYERESYTSGTLVAWVEISSLSATANTVIYMYYGNSEATDQQNKTGTWNSNFEAVYHFSETSGTLYDATSNNYDLAAYNTPTYAQTGRVGNSILLDDVSSEYLQIDAAPVTASPLTITVWFNDDESSTSSISDRTMVQVCDKDASAEYFRLSRKATNPNNYVELTASDGTSNSVATNTPYSRNTWEYASAVFTSATSRDVYLRAGGKNSGSTSITPTGLNRITIGRGDDSSPDDYWSGYIDEVRISNVALAEGWLLTEYNNQNAPGSFYSVGSQALPVDLLYFRAIDEDNLVKLEWGTASEIIHEMFSIEKSFDGHNFNVIGHVKDAGTSFTQLNYTFIDDAPIADKIYYRLKQIDFDGSFSYSAMAVIEVYHPFGNLHVYPSPASESVTLELETLYALSATLTVSDMWGKILLHESIESVTGTNYHRLNTSNFPSGMYVVRYDCGLRSFTEKVHILH